MTGPGRGCIIGSSTRDPHQGVCLRVTGDKAAWNADIARLVKQGSLTVSGPGTHCGPDPAPYIDTPVEGVEEAFGGDYWRSIYWQRLEVDPDGRTLHVYYYGLPVGCHALDRVEVTHDRRWARRAGVHRATPGRDQLRDDQRALRDDLDA